MKFSTVFQIATIAAIANAAPAKRADLPTGALTALPTGVLPTDILPTGVLPTDGLTDLSPILSLVSGVAQLLGTVGDLPVVGDLPIVGDLLQTIGQLPEELTSNLDLSSLTSALPTGALSGVTGGLSGVTGGLSGLTDAASGLTGAASGLTGAASGLTGAASDVTGATSGLSKLVKAAPYTNSTSA